MTIGRTSDKKIKIKTAADAGLRAVSCACCANCGVYPSVAQRFTEAGVPMLSYIGTPADPAIFKYRTFEFKMPAWSAGNFDSSRPEEVVVCAPAGDEEEINCGTLPAFQSMGAGHADFKFTQFVDEECAQPIVKAEGFQFGFFAKYGVSSFSFSSIIEDAKWDTIEENGTVFLSEKKSDAKWVSQCVGDGECPDGIGSGGFLIDDMYPWIYSVPVEDGKEAKGYRVVERNVMVIFNVYPDFSGYFGGIYENYSYHVKYTVHNTLKEIWGPDQPEMRP
jgi:hypothetical protein